MGSTVEYRFIDNGTKFLKVATIVMVFVVVLGSAVVSKGVLLFMTSQVKQNVTRQYCNKYLGKLFFRKINGLTFFVQMLQDSTSL